MTIRTVPHQTWIRRGVAPGLSVILVSALVALVWGGQRLTSPPRTQAEAEAHLDRSIVAYALWEDVPFVVFEYGGVLHFDRLVLDLISIEWPPTPCWQWTGSWWTMPATTNPASVGTASTQRSVPTDPYRYASGADTGGGANQGRPVIYGQINADTIAWLEVRSDGEWQRYPVSAPGFAIRLAEGQPVPRDFRWLDADGAVIWSVDRDAD